MSEMVKAPNAASVITNIAAYQFAPLADLKDLRQRLLAQCKSDGLKGTILLSVEGINLFVAGARPGIDHLLATIRTVPGLEKLTPKISESEHQPFRRMLVRIKREIISFGVEGIEPGVRTSPKLSPRELKTWLDEGRPVTLLDTRNDYEVKLGTFHNARVLEIDHFRQFPEAVRQLPPEMKATPIVMFCTGGIRCEKAGPFMEKEGFQHIFQLDGGILKYFEEVGADHYDGECFVFDQRVGVDPALSETDSALCFVCQTPLTAEEQDDPRFVENVSCPACYRNPAEEMAQTLAQRHEQIRQATNPLPGSQPYENKRPLNIPAGYDRQTLLAALVGIFPHVAAAEWSEILHRAQFLDPLGKVALADRIVRSGERYTRLTPAMIEPEINPAIRIFYEDEAIVVLEKPAPLPMHPCGRFNRNTLQFILHQVYAPQKIQPAHRLDANTTGLVVCTRTRSVANRMQTQFAEGKVGKIYLAKIQGHPSDDSFRCDAPISNEPGPAGSREIADDGQIAETHFFVIKRFPDRTSLVEARPITGRTNQIRAHLWHLGFPICGDATYLPGFRFGSVQTLSLEAPPLCLHLWKLTFQHPQTGEPQFFETPRPIWSADVPANRPTE